jgi:hypothetical protein
MNDELGKNNREEVVVDNFKQASQNDLERLTRIAINL